jgi:hypothetical protein
MNVEDAVLKVCFAGGNVGKMPRADFMSIDWREIRSFGNAGRRQMSRQLFLASDAPVLPGREIYPLPQEAVSVRSAVAMKNYWPLNTKIPEK